MLVGPLYPILHIVNEREVARSFCNTSDSEVSKHSQISSFLTVSSNFEPRRTRGTSPFVSSAASSIVFRPDLVFMLLRMAHKESDLRSICIMASRILHKLAEPILSQEALVPPVEVAFASDDMLKSEPSNRVSLVDYSALFGDEFCMPNYQWDLRILNVLDVAAVEEGILHVLYACASQSLLCHKLAENIFEFWSALPLIQALLPALRPSLSSLGENVDKGFSQWKQPLVQQALSQIVATSCSAVYRSLLHACAGYLSSFSQYHAKAACILIDLCSGVLAPWINQVVAKVDLAMELLEDLLGTILDARHSLVRARAALKYIIVALSGQMDDVLGKYKEAKHKILFLLEMLEPFLDPAVYAWKSRIAFGDISFNFLENQEQVCVVALNIIRTAVQKPAVLPSLESEWRHGSVAPSVLLSVLEPHMQLPPEIDLCKCHQHEFSESPQFSVLRHGGSSSGSNNQDEADGKTDVPDTYLKLDLDDANLLFAPPELQALVLTNVCKSPKVDSNHRNANSELKHAIEENFNRLFHSGLVFDAKFTPEFFNLQADYFQLVNYRDSEIRASEFQRLALDLMLSQGDLSLEGHDAAIDALLLAAECYINPLFMISVRPSSPIIGQENINETKIAKGNGGSDLGSASNKFGRDLGTLANLEKERDKVVLQLVLEAAELYEKFRSRMSDGQELQIFTVGGDEKVIKLSPHDVKSADAVTLVRQNQALLFSFLIWRLKKEQNSMHEILMHCLIFLLHSATQLCCDPEEVIDIILGSAEYLNRLLTSIFSQFKEGNLQLDSEKLHGLQRRWILLLKLVVASSSGEGTEFPVNRENRFRCGNLIPPSAWMQRISDFSQNACPLVRFLGWMAVSRNAKHYCKERLFLAADLHNLTNLLSIFVDELLIVDNVSGEKISKCKDQQLGLKQESQRHDEVQLAGSRGGGHSFHVVFPDLSKFFPCLQEQFQCFGESILEAVGLQLRSLSSGFVPDILSWFSSLCSWPFFQTYHFGFQNSSGHVKGYVAKNAKAIILYILEAIVIEHMESMVPEIPRVVQVLAVLCRAPYCDVSFLDSIIRLLKPIITYSLHKALDEEKVADNDCCLNFESLCFDKLFVDIKMKSENPDRSGDEDYSRALAIFILASVFTDLSFPRTREILQSLTFWADFAGFEPTTSFCDYLSAFQIALESCKVLLVQTLEVFGAVPFRLPHSSDFDTIPVWDNGLVTQDSYSWFLKELFHNSYQTTSIEKLDGDKFDAPQKNCLAANEIADFSEDLEILISKLNPSIERCWNLHPRLANKLTITSAQCLVYLRCLSLIASHVQQSEEGMEDHPSLVISNDQVYAYWQIALGALAEKISKLQENHCWEVSSLMLDCLLAVPSYFRLENTIDSVCTVIKVVACCAPKIAWRLRSDRWLSTLFRRGVHGVQEGEGPLTDLFVTLLGHPEPEQRSVVLQHLGRLVGLDIISEAAPCVSKCCNKLLSPALFSVPESFLSLLVSSTWDVVVLLASSDALLTLRVHALALLVGYIPFAARHQLQSFLAASDILFKGSCGTCEGPVLRLSLALLAGACLYSPVENIPLIPQDVWRKIKIIGSSRTGKPSDLEKKLCEALCKLRNQEDEDNQVLKEALSSSSTKQVDPDFGSTRESIVQVLPNLTSVQSCFDMFSKRIDQEEIELEEAEIELEVLLKEDMTQEQLKFSVEERQNMLVNRETKKNDGRLQQIKNQIDSINKAKLREEIVARRQKKLLTRLAHQKRLEEAALREEELLRELDRERMAEVEKDIERQRLLEVERAKTRELRHHLEMEKERQIQRELQREQEQTETGLRSSRREFPSSSHSSRPRDRYRERENGRGSMEGGARTSGVGLQAEISSASAFASVPVVLSSSRQFAGQPPTMLQSRDRSDEAGSSYEENFDGSRDSGDTGSVGDPDSVSLLDGQSGGYGSAQRHGSRGSKPRQIMERRERDGRREGKWERKAS